LRRAGPAYSDGREPCCARLAALRAPDGTAEANHGSRFALCRAAGVRYGSRSPLTRAHVSAQRLRRADARLRAGPHGPPLAVPARSPPDGGGTACGHHHPADSDPPPRTASCRSTLGVPRQAADRCGGGVAALRQPVPSSASLRGVSDALPLRFADSTALRFVPPANRRRASLRCARPLARPSPARF